MVDFNEDTDLEAEEDKIKLEIAKREKDTDREIRTRLQTILRKNEDQLLLEDKKFLKARASYLSKAQREEYANVISASYYNETGVPQAVVPPALEDLTRPELDDKARALGVEKPEELPNKKAVIEAIKHNQ